MKHSFLFVCYVTLICCSFANVFAYQNGAPALACDTMTPGHGSPSNNPCPFEIVIDQTEIFSNGSLSVTLSSKNANEKFKGFLVMGFNNQTGTSLGTFQPLSGLSQSLKCHNFDDAAATHTSNLDKSSVSIRWLPPQGFDGNAVFKVTYVKNHEIYWAKQLSQTVKITRSENSSSTTVKPMLTTEKTPIPNVYEGCGTSKGCLAPVKGCIDLLDCDMMASFRKVINSSTLEVEIFGQIGENNYIAVGFSTDNKMGTDSVVECVTYGTTVNAHQSYNTHDEGNNRLQTNTPGFSLSTATYSDGNVYCKILHPIVFKNNDEFNLNDPYYVLMAAGDAGQRNIYKHYKKMSSRSSISLVNDVSVIYLEDSRILKQLHGSFMVIAWLIAASIGVFMPRYMKKTWVGKQFMGKDMWFVYHRALMVCAWTLTMVAFILIFIDVDGWVSEPISENPHPLIGCITTVLAFIQPIMAGFRPAPDAPNRYMFNWAHMIVGYSAHILAITCIFLAVEMEEAQLKRETYWILTAHVCCYVLTHLLLTFLARRQPNRMFDALKESTSKAKYGSSVRKIILLIYTLSVIGLASTVIVFIAEV